MKRLEQIRTIIDPMQRARDAHTAIEELQAEVGMLAAARRDALNELVEQGKTLTQIAEALGVTRGRISQLRSAGTKPERNFFGSGTVTVAIGSKPEHGRRDNANGEMVSKQAIKAYETIAESLRELGLDTKQEIVPPSGLINLNREPLVVLCAVRVLPFLAQVMAADSHLEFREDESGWYLHDKSTSTDYRSPQDQGESRDIGYVGRLPGPGGKTTFLYAAGIHAQGTLGAAKWMAENVADLYKQLKLQRFSTLVESSFGKDGTVSSTRRLTELYREAK